jgi:histidinol-phosphate phosphatase family protein
LAKARNKAVFLDRDGTIARDVPYCSRPEDFELLPRVDEAIKLLNDSGLKVVVITNQSGIGRGYFTEDMLDKIHHEMLSELNDSGAVIDAIYYCPHHPDDDCECRKPKPTMLLQAAHDLNINLRQSYFIGDSDLDVEAGKNAGCSTIRINSGLEAVNKKTLADFVCPDLYTGAKWVIAQTGISRSRKK